VRLRQSQRDEVGRAAEHVVAQRQAELERRPLVVERDPRPLGERELAAVHVGLAGQHPEQGRLAGPVRPGQRKPLAALHLERDTVEEERAGELLAEVGGDDDGHRYRLRSQPTTAVATASGASSSTT